MSIHIVLLFISLFTLHSYSADQPIDADRDIELLILDEQLEGVPKKNIPIDYEQEGIDKNQILVIRVAQILQQHCAEQKQAPDHEIMQDQALE